VYCEYSTGSRIDRKNQRVREAEQVADWILIFCRWVIVVPRCAAQILKAAMAAVAVMAAARWRRRRLQRGSLVRNLPRFCSFRWMTYCLGQGWTNAPPGLLPTLVARAPNRDVSGYGLCGAIGVIRNDHFLSCSEEIWGFAVPALGALGHSTDFSMPAYAADF
jgi:hypothetical protein